MVKLASPNWSGGTSRPYSAPQNIGVNKSRLAALTTAALLSFAGAASPAQTVFDQVARLLQTRYGGLSTVDRANLVAQYQAKLTTACASDLEGCKADVAYPLLEQEVADLKDAHSFFEKPESYDDFKARQSGAARLQYGIKLGNLDGGDQVITGVIPGSAAFDAGLRRGDRLVSIDGQKYSYDALRASRAKGTPIALGVKRGDQSLTVRLQARESSSSDLPSISYVGDLGVLNIPSFLSGGEVAQRVHDLVREAQNKGTRGLLVDLRDDPGGDLGECDLSISAFVPSFTRVARSANGDSPSVVTSGLIRNGRNVFQGVNNPAFWNGPLSVLVNKSSASCSEFFAREIQFAKRGQIIGEPTAGVGNTATIVFPLDGDAALQLTTTHYVKPDGTPYAERVTPDVAFTDDLEQLGRGQDVLLEKALAVLKSEIVAAPAAGQ